MTAAVTVQRFIGHAVRPHLEAVARLRMAVFRDWPYLYDGDMGYEREYLSTYAASSRSVFVLAFDGEDVVGASTGIPLADDDAAFRVPFEQRRMDVHRVFIAANRCCCPRIAAMASATPSSIIAKHMRAHWAASSTPHSVRWIGPIPTRAARLRTAINAGFWRKRGYVRQPGMAMHLDWNEIGVGETTHALTFWLRPLEQPVA